MYHLSFEDPTYPPPLEGQTTVSFQQESPAGENMGEAGAYYYIKKRRKGLEGLPLQDDDGAGESDLLRKALETLRDGSLGSGAELYYRKTHRKRRREIQRISDNLIRVVQIISTTTVYATTASTQPRFPPMCSH